jgi:hypothetical protein
MLVFLGFLFMQRLSNRALFEDQYSDCLAF